MQKIVILITSLFFSLVACAADSETESDHKASDYPTGMITKTELREHEKFFSHYEVEISDEDVKLLKAVDKPIVITTYFGLWCHDSQREVPELLALLDAADNKNIGLRLIALDIEKKEPFGRQEEDKVLYTPTMIVKIDGEEKGRIVERPNDSLAKDIVSFVKD